MNLPKISIVIPVYQMDNAQEFLKRNLDSIVAQKFTDYEIIVSDDSDDDQLKIFCYQYPVKWFKNPGNKGMANNTNYGWSKAEGDLIKILFQDDYFAHQDSLQEIVKGFTGAFDWLVTGCNHTTGPGQINNDHFPYYSESENTIGSPSVLTVRQEVLVRFDPQFHWVLDLDLYKRLFREYGKPKILNKINVVIGLHSGQKTHLLSEERKIKEHQTLMQKFEI